MVLVSTMTSKRIRQQLPSLPRPSQRVAPWRTLYRFCHFVTFSLFHGKMLGGRTSHTPSTAQNINPITAKGLRHYHVLPLPPYPWGPLQELFPLVNYAKACHIGWGLCVSRTKAQIPLTSQYPGRGGHSDPTFLSQGPVQSINNSICCCFKKP